VHRRRWEIPAGLLGWTSESPVEVASGELAEEGRLRAGKWHALVEILTPPRMCGELENGTIVSGLEAARVALSDGLAGLRQDDAPWRARKRPE